MKNQVVLHGSSLLEWRNALMVYEFAIEEINTKLRILSKEFGIIQKRNPIEHMKSRVKNFDSITTKLERKGHDVTVENARKYVKDIAGVRIICSFKDDIYTIAKLIEEQHDITVLDIKDYVEHPKANGYRSFHMLISLPVFLSDRVEEMPIEIQIRTSAMDFWASLEHKIYYKYNASKKGEELTEELKHIADMMQRLDERMIGIKEEIEEK